MPAGIVPALLRTRPVVSGESFSVHASVAEFAHVRGVLIVAVPKRILRRAVDRNTVRRVAREAWRALALDGSSIVALLRMKKGPAGASTGAPAASGSRARKLAVRAELDSLFETLRRRVAEGRIAGRGPKERKGGPTAGEA